MCVRSLAQADSRGRRVTSDKNRPSACRGSGQDVLEDALVDRINRAIAELKGAFDAAAGQPTAQNLVPAFAGA